MVVDQKVAAAGMWVGAVTKAEAMQNAQKECKKAGGLICNDVYTYKNSCGAVIAMVGGGHVYTNDDTEKLAIQRGMKACAREGKKCEVYYSECSPSVVVPIY